MNQKFVVKKALVLMTVIAISLISSHKSDSISKGKVKDVQKHLKQFYHIEADDKKVEEALKCLKESIPLFKYRHQHANDSNAIHSKEHAKLLKKSKEHCEDKGVNPEFRHKVNMTIGMMRKNLDGYLGYHKSLFF